MARLKRITWGYHNPFSDPRLFGLERRVREFRQRPQGKRGGKEYENRECNLPLKGEDYYREYDLEAVEKGKDRGKLRLILGLKGEVYITGNHYEDVRQVINLPD